MTYDKDWALRWLNDFGERVQENKQLLSDLDQAIGDGDHGINMARGLSELKKAFAEKEPADLKDVFKTAGMTMVSKVGGASGPLYGTAFLNMSKAVEADTIDAVGLTKVIEAGLEGIEKRGKSHAGEKTMIDVWEPVVHALHQEDLTDDVVDAALQKTKDLKATKGRASYLGERSIGHLDPGAYSSALLFHAMLQTEVS
ncbi:dihydroxyacetone kinase ADP-binding subunit DhaL1 [Listeria cossartiae subsp. cayugensis]|uniref:Dihydroxyacetone kinase ADP-binding subunit DhaL1 n=1 Tax=Listeria cossartiae subsp. cayugensis TaxID=2713505 RepID=A0ABU2IR56_9LIST|nr:dihydroxyacetone kinase ADP-binding subunit DhaL1 [Listeria cossartiae]MBC1806355.1 dihydroxyacetone kinase subunit L [Listeria cossartiae subsp. cayugensis]MDT0050352.1 dihydroxyacetone kinase ADP-binding subunit DhaL1 [Listeria cossartiae subsp. cayugensis]MDT0066602.1 dihydroxyacetone kinase ADP-binding subunit DhaL1 [Listeria cossartiae subsp. cayugensis]MDT0080743.1 dihydroxyacetone kinase ADP-binding subunit DhaL1 [Listeria cossartiae subsp. cayugensis]MDT0082821.1 dihydroxyacetone ki